MSMHGTQKFHAFVPLKRGAKIQRKALLFSLASKIHAVIHLENILSIEKLICYVIASNNNLEACTGPDLV